MYKTILLNFINQEQEFCQLARKIDWDSLEKDLNPYYSQIGHPAVPVRTIVGLLLLKQIYDQGDDTVMERWLENPYWQHFTGEMGMPRILQESLHLFTKEELKQAVKEVRIVTTVQDKNITFPMDRKLYEKVIAYCIRIAEKEGIKVKRTYPREIRKLRNALRFSYHPRNHKKKDKVEKWLYHLAVGIYNDFLNLVGPFTEAHNDLLDVIYRIFTQKREDSNKVYLIHEPDVHCISKGKEHKKNGNRNKSGVANSRYGGFIIAALAFEKNPFEGHTLASQLVQIEELTGLTPRYAIVDRGYRGQNQMVENKVVMPKNLRSERPFLKKKREERCRSRSGVEALISQLKIDHRMLGNYLKGTQGGKINTIMAAAAYNMKKWMTLQRGSIIVLCRFLFFRSLIQVPVLIEILESEKIGIKGLTR